jgi:FtsP/CotA-like multicopper oxidase with cupredoxin domain
VIAEAQQRKEGALTDCQNLLTREKWRKLMKTKITILLLGAILIFAGMAGAVQDLLPGELIPKFVDELPVAGDISVINATSEPIASIPSVYNADYVPPAPLAAPAGAVGGSPYNIHLREFKAQILPSTGVPAADAFAGLPPNTASWVWGYLTDGDNPDLDPNVPGPVRKSYLGPVVVAERGVPAYPTYLNELPRLQDGFGFVQKNLLPIDQTLDWANPNNTDPQFDAAGNWTNPIVGQLPYVGGLPDSVHIHGGEVPPASDGGPDSWFTQGNEITGVGFSGNTLVYPNGQEEATIWFHPHGFGITRLNVYAGMAGVYPIMDLSGESAPNVPMPAFPQHDIPLIIQDRSFDTTGQIFFWIPEFIGDVICVNGKTWPNLNVEPRQYRFRLLNGSNARFYDLYLINAASGTPFIGDNGSPFIAIATDDGYVESAVLPPVYQSTGGGDSLLDGLATAGIRHILIAPGERYEIIVDFRNVSAGTQIILKNSANTPFPGGGPVNTGTTDTVMRFTVVDDAHPLLPSSTVEAGNRIRPGGRDLEPIVEAHVPASGSITRQLTLNEVIGAGGPLELVVNNSKYNMKSYDPAAITPRLVPVLPGCPSGDPLCRETELPAVGDTEIWEIINISADAHPMHTHLVSFQLLDRTPFNSGAWITKYNTLLLSNGVLPGGGPPNQYNVKNADGAIGGNPAVGPFLDIANRRGPESFELGWKDTVVAYPGEVTRFVVRWAPQDDPATGDGAPTAGTNHYPFDPTALIGGVGYVWHCHILDHEDNEMMRNYVVMNARQPIAAYAASADINGDGCIDRTDYALLMTAIRRGTSAGGTGANDINGDGVVNIADARALVLKFTNPGGTACPPAAP